MRLFKNTYVKINKINVIVPVDGKGTSSSKSTVQGSLNYIDMVISFSHCVDIHEHGIAQCTEN